MTPDELVERVVAEAYRKEAEVEENVARSLPFFAASLALLATLLGLIRPVMPPLIATAYAVAAYLLLVGIGVAVALVLVSLLRAVRPRPFVGIMSEQQLIGYAEELKEFYGVEGADDAAAAQQAVVGDLREHLIEQYARAAETNRAANRGRLRARAQGFTALVAALLFAFLLLALIFGARAMA